MNLFQPKIVNPHFIFRLSCSSTSESKNLLDYKAIQKSTKKSDIVENTMSDLIFFNDNLQGNYLLRYSCYSVNRGASRFILIGPLVQAYREK